MRQPHPRNAPRVYVIMRRGEENFFADKSFNEKENMGKLWQREALELFIFFPDKSTVWRLRSAPTSTSKLKQRKSTAPSSFQLQSSLAETEKKTCRVQLEGLQDDLSATANIGRERGKLQ